MINNIFYNHHSYRGSMTVDADCLNGFVSDYNAVMDGFTTTDGDSVLTLAQWRVVTGQDAHSFVATPGQLFADDYQLSATSPAIDAGTATNAPASGLAGTRRPQGGGVDVGAYERVSDAPDPAPQPAAATPTPAG